MNKQEFREKSDEILVEIRTTVSGYNDAGTDAEKIIKLMDMNKAQNKLLVLFLKRIQDLEA